MKYDEINDVETQITPNDYVTFDVKPKRSVKGLIGRAKNGTAGERITNVALASVVVLTAVSLGFLISQIAKYATLSAATSILSFIL